MSDSNSFCTQFKPVQPAAIQHKQVTYREFAPDHRLQNLIYCYWILNSETPLSSTFTYRVVSDGCIDLFFEPENPGESYVMGLSPTSVSFPLGQQFCYSGIRFLPGAFPLLARIDAAELTGKAELLSNIAPNIAEYLSNQISREVDAQKLKENLDIYFLNNFYNLEERIDSRLQNALFSIFKSGGNLQLQKELKAEISARQLRRLFHTYVGESPKTFSKIVRFQNALSQMVMQRNRQMFWEAGYYDQPHFIKDFKKFAGTTPLGFVNQK